MCQENEDGFYYISVYNENYAMPEMPSDCAEGILNGIYKLPSNGRAEKKDSPRPQLFGSGPLLNEVRRAQSILAERFGIGSDVWSVTSYSQLFRDAPHVRAVEPSASEGEAASQLLGAGLGRALRPVHRRQRQRAARRRSDPSLGSGALSSRWGRTASDAATRAPRCGGTSRSMRSTRSTPP